MAGGRPEAEGEGFHPSPLYLCWLVRAGELVDRYRDLPLGLVDATVVAATEMLEEPKLVTLDQRHFGVVRPTHVPALTLLPEQPT